MAAWRTEQRRRRLARLAIKDQQATRHLLSRITSRSICACNIHPTKLVTDLELVTCQTCLNIIAKGPNLKTTRINTSYKRVPV